MTDPDPDLYIPPPFSPSSPSSSPAKQLLLEGSSKAGGAGTGFDVARSGDGRVALIGFPRYVP
jgi:hypothetical protein